jgi:hypothetical protein
MKKIMMVAITLIASVSVFAQTKKVSSVSTSTKVYKLLYSKDNMTDDEYLQPNWNLIAKKTEKTGFLVKPKFTKGDSSVWVYKGLTVFVAGIGNCHEDDYLIIMFEDGTKVRTDMWNKFDCEGDVYMDWDGELEKDLRTKPIKVVRLTNGRSFDSHEVVYTKVEDKNYFITYFKKLDEFNLKNSKLTVSK